MRRGCEVSFSVGWRVKGAGTARLPRRERDQHSEIKWLFQNALIAHYSKLLPITQEKRHNK